MRNKRIDYIFIVALPIVVVWAFAIPGPGGTDKIWSRMAVAVVFSVAWGVVLFFQVRD
jgi:hypothetical protein